uniref:Uncharacterized protein n=1 Tax=Arundo donax TaxID=35708 RepID=A0A0A9C8Y4_ARUDO
MMQRLEQFPLSKRISSGHKALRFGDCLLLQLGKFGG